MVRYFFENKKAYGGQPKIRERSIRSSRLTARHSNEQRGRISITFLYSDDCSSVPFGLAVTKMARPFETRALFLLPIRDAAHNISVGTTTRWPSIIGYDCARHSKVVNVYELLLSSSMRRSRRDVSVTANTRVEDIIAEHRDTAQSKPISRARTSQ